MATINSASESSGRKRAGVQRMTKHHLKVDMTPMVDLGFLLIAFFVMTTQLSQPTAMDLYMPKDGGPPTELGRSNALTILAGDDKLYYYNGEWKEAIASGGIRETVFSGEQDLRQVITEKQRQLDITQKAKEGREGLMVLIKPATSASYGQVVDILDEMTISMVKKYAIIKMSDEERQWLENKISE